MSEILEKLGDRVGSLEVGQAKLQSDVEHLMESVDNHLAGAVEDIGKEIRLMCPMVKESYKWVTWTQKFLIFTALGALVMAGMGAAFYTIRLYNGS